MCGEKPEKPLLAVSPAVGNVYTVGGGGMRGGEGRCTLYMYVLATYTAPKYLRKYRKSTTVYVPSLELGLPHPTLIPQASVSSLSSPLNQRGGGGTRWGKGGGRVPIPTTEKKVLHSAHSVYTAIRVSRDRNETTVSVFIKISTICRNFLCEETKFLIFFYWFINPF